VLRRRQTEAWGGGGGDRHRAVPEGRTTGDEEEGDVEDVGSGGEADLPPGVEEKPAVG
jgi:hypothetical protein